MKFSELIAAVDSMRTILPDSEKDIDFETNITSVNMSNSPTLGRKLILLTEKNNRES